MRSPPGIDARRVAMAALCAVMACGEPARRPAAQPGPSSGEDAPPPPAVATRAAPPFAMLSTGPDHTCGIDTDGGLFCWGRNDLGQVGDGTTESRALPTAIAGDARRWTSVAAGAGHTCGLTTKGATFCWGSSVADQLGTDTIGSRPIPTPVGGVPAFTVLTAGENHTCGLTADGTVWCWGENEHGELGRGTRTAGERPASVAPGIAFRAVSAGYHDTCAITREGKLYCWGLDNGGSLGHEARSTCADEATSQNLCTLSPAVTADSLRFVAVSTGFSHTCALTPDGLVYCWGANDAGELGTGFHDALWPTQIAGDTHFRQIAAGDEFTCGITSDGTAQCWGSNSEGQLAATDPGDASLPAAVAGDRRWISLSAGRSHTCALATDHVAYCWGSNAEGQLGVGSRKRTFTPEPVLFPP